MPLTSDSRSDVPTTNWGGNLTYSARQVHLPTSDAEVQRIVTSAASVKALGTRHSFNRVADTNGDLVCLREMNRIIALDEDRSTLTVEAGVTYGAAGVYLHQRGYALNNLPSLPHVCIGGAVATGTHGSGTTNLSADVVALDVVLADGQIQHCSREADGDSFDGMVVGLGALGIVTQLTIKVRRMISIVQEVYEGVPFDAVLANYDELVASGYSVSLFTDWQRPESVNQVWLKRSVPENGTLSPLSFEFLAGKRATTKQHPIAGTPAEFCTEQGIAGPAHERLPHFRADSEPSSAGAELQSEYFVSRQDAVAALRAIAAVGPQLCDCLMISEVRTVEADRLWLSPCYERRSIGIHFTWQKREADVTRLLQTVVEPALEPFSPRPHWGKVFTLSPAVVRSRYERLPAFRQLCEQLDPNRKFSNDFVDSYLFAPVST